MKSDSNRSLPLLLFKMLSGLLLSAAIVLFMGCQAITGSSETTADAETTSDASETAEQSAETTVSPESLVTPAQTPIDTPIETPTEAPTDTPLAVTPTPAATSTVTQVNLSKILNEIAELQIGSAGTALKEAAAAAKVLDWAETTTLSTEAIADKIAQYTDDLSDPTDVGTFYIHFNVISDIPQEIIDGNASTIGTVSDAGYTLQYASYTQEKWDTFLEAYQDCLPGMYTSYAHMSAFDSETGWAMFDYWDMLKGDAAVAWLVAHEGYTETDAQTLVDGWSDSEFIEKNTNPRLRVVDMSDVSITMMYHADGSPVTDAIAVSLTYSEFVRLYNANPDGVLDTYFYRVTVSGGEVTDVDQLYWP